MEFPRDTQLYSQRIVWKFWLKSLALFLKCDALWNFNFLIKMMIFWIWIEMKILDWQSKSKIRFWLWIVNHNPIHQIGLQSGLSNPSIQSSNTLVRDNHFCDHFCSTKDYFKCQHFTLLKMTIKCFSHYATSLIGLYFILFGWRVNKPTS